MKEFERRYNQYNYTLQRKMDSRETFVCKIPVPEGETKRVKAIYWSALSDVTVYATLGSNITSPYIIWEKLEDKSELSPAVTALKFQNTTSNYRYIFVWVIME